MTLAPAEDNGHYTLRVADKFGRAVTTPPGQVHCDLSVSSAPAPISAPAATEADAAAKRGTSGGNARS